MKKKHLVASFVVKTLRKAYASFFPAAVPNLFQGCPEFRKMDISIKKFPTSLRSYILALSL
jgi:hypothetical protein